MKKKNNLYQWNKFSEAAMMRKWGIPEFEESVSTFFHRDHRH